MARSIAMVLEVINKNTTKIPDSWLIERTHRMHIMSVLCGAIYMNMIYCCMLFYNLFVRL